MEEKQISVLIPAYNEQAKITQTIKSLQTISGIREIIVIDDGSTDKTAFYAKNSGAITIRLKENKGKGEALNFGAAYLTGQFVALLDADLGTSALEIRKLIMPVFNKQTDIAIAIFPQSRKKGGMGLVKMISTLGLQRITKRRFQAPLSGQRLMSTAVFNSLLPLSSGFGAEVGMNIAAFKKGYRILEIETGMRHSETGRNWSGFWHRGIQFKDILIVLVQEVRPK